MGRLGLHQRKKQLIEDFPRGLCGNGSKYERTFAERLRGPGPGNGARKRIASAEALPCKIGGLDAVHCRWYIEWRCEFPFYD